MNTFQPDADEAGTLRVLDTTAIPPYTPRNHAILVDGQEVHYAFHAGKPLEMPRAHALKFLAIPSFQVTDIGGDRYAPPADPKKSEAADGVRLADDEVVARLDELTVDALLLRANMINGGEKLTKRDGRPAVQSFLASHLKRAKDASRRAAARSEAGVGDGDVEDMGPGELDNLFGAEA